MQTPLSNVISTGVGGGSTGATLGGLAGNANVGNAVGGMIGNSVGQNVAAPFIAHMTNPSSDLPDPGFQSPLGLPSDLSGMSSFTPQQQLSGIATQGVYGGGASTQDDQYFLNQLNNQLINPTPSGAMPLGGSNNGYAGISSVSPIENSFLAKLGLGGNTDTTSLLRAMQGWQPPQT